MADAASAPALVVGMPPEEVRLRLEVYDPGGEFTRQLGELWERAETIIIESTGEHIEAMAASLNRDAVASIESVRQQLLKDAYDHARRKFSSGMSAAWIDGVCQRAPVIWQRGVAIPMVVAGVQRIAALITQRIREGLDLPPEHLSRLCNTVHLAAGYEIEVLLWQMGEFRRQEVGRDRMRRAQEFHDLVSGSVEHAHINAQTLVKQTAGTIDRSRVTLSNVCEVAGAAQQSAAAMRDAAETAANLNAAIESVTAGLGKVLATEERASNDAETAREAADELSREIGAIASVLDMIRAIAGQTNMLALNATIEAARAGEAGRGFAIVAQEVKSLASQTARATDQIGERIGAIHSANERSATRSAEGRSTMLEARAALGEMAGTMRAQSSQVAAIVAAIDETATSSMSMSDLIAQVNERTSGMRVELERLSEVFTEVVDDLGHLKRSTGEFVEIMGA